MIMRFNGNSSQTEIEVNKIYPATITEINDITDKVGAFADIGIEVKLNAKSVPFDLRTTAFIKFERRSNGELDPDKNTWSGPFNSILDCLKYPGGFDRFGAFRDMNGEEIPANDIVPALREHLSKEFGSEHGYPFLVYVEKDKKGYTSIKRKIFPASEYEKMKLYAEASNKYKKDQATTTPPRNQTSAQARL